MLQIKSPNNTTISIGQNLQSILSSAQARYAAKAFDPEKKLTETQINVLKEIIRLSPSSLNIQPWHFLIISSDEAKSRLIKSCHGMFEYNAQKFQNASLTVVFCAKTEASHDQVTTVLDQEFADGRFASETLKEERQALMNGYIDKLNTQTQGQVQGWLDKQTYIALGNALLAAADMGIDSVPVEGFDKEIVNSEFGLLEKGYHATVIASFGYRSETDFNAKLDKSRLSNEVLFTEL